MLNNVVICSNQQQSTGHENVRVAGIKYRKIIIKRKLHNSIAVTYNSKGGSVRLLRNFYVCTRVK